MNIDFRSSSNLWQVEAILLSFLSLVLTSVHNAGYQHSLVMFTPYIDNKTPCEILQPSLNNTVRKTHQISLVTYLYPLTSVNFQWIGSRSFLYVSNVSFSLTEVGAMQFTFNSNRGYCPIRSNLIFFLRNTLQQD